MCACVYLLRTHITSHQNHTHTYTNTITYLRKYFVSSTKKYFLLSLQFIFPLLSHNILHSSSSGEEEEGG